MRNIYLGQEWALILFRWRQKNLNARHTGMKPPKKLVILAVKAACLLTASNVTILARLGIGGFRKFPEALHLYARLPDTSAVSPQLRRARACRCHIGIAARRALVACVNPYRSQTRRCSCAPSKGNKLS